MELVGLSSSHPGGPRYTRIHRPSNHSNFPPRLEKSLSLPRPSLFIVPVAGIRDDKPATIHPRARSARNAQDLVVARGSRGENGVEMAVHGWPTALCELFQAQVMFEACAHARIRAYTHTSVENGNGGYGPVVAGWANGQKGRSEETAYASAQP